MGFGSWIKRNLGGIGGAVLGTLIAPGIGTAIGAGLGEGVQTYSQTGDLGKALSHAALTGGGIYGLGTAAGAAGVPGLGSFSAGAGAAGAGAAGAGAAGAGAAGAGAAGGSGYVGVSTPMLGGGSFATNLPAGMAGSGYLGATGSSLIGGPAGGAVGSSLLGKAAAEGGLAEGAGGVLPLSAEAARVGAGAAAGSAGAPVASTIAPLKSLGVKGLITKAMSNPLAVGFGGMSILDLVGRFSQGKKESQGLEEYFSQVAKAQDAAQWTDADRKGLMNAVMGIISERETAGTKQAASFGAATGRGGGSFGKDKAKMKREGLNTAAQTLVNTYGPSNIPVPSADAYLAKSKADSPVSQWLNDVLGLGGQVLGTTAGLKLAKGLI